MENTITKLLGLPPVSSAHGAQIDLLLFYVHLLMVALAIGWGIFFLVCLWRYAQRRRSAADPIGVRGHLSSYLEVGVAGIEALLLIGLAVPIWARGGTAGNFPKPEESTVVRVIGRQFNWIARYPGADGVFAKGDAKFLSVQNPLGIDPEDPAGKDDVVVESSEVVVPVNKPVIAYVSSLDVIHNFAVKTMRIAQDAIPGMSNPIWFTPTEIGTNLITCGQLCGNGHSQMRGLFKVVEPAEYRAYLKERTKSGPVDTSGYE
jgi:cytochrome c oxidase subunit 2